MAEGKRVVGIRCRRMTKTRMRDAERLLNSFLRTDTHYLKTSEIYGDLGVSALRRALSIFLRRPELGFVWLAYLSGEPAGVCVVSMAVSTSIGGYVAKLDDVYVEQRFQRLGVGREMLQALSTELKRSRIRRIDTSVHKHNRAADRYYRNMGFRPLGEERLSKVL